MPFDFSTELSLFPRFSEDDVSRRNSLAPPSPPSKQTFQQMREDQDFRLQDNITFSEALGSLELSESKEERIDFGSRAGTSGRRSVGTPKSYKEPSLRVKIRKGHQFFTPS